ncbi:carboxy-terminal kinesin 2 [Parasteatoda tepidariorum]|uniref:carboxy-terminal kinesin 2 n=1 Tax=Parasteatoda tepidariorum TaxID=114398 RepID=UPI00077F98AC|nr:carboxy-terminal kinesin 2 [Parasteatoda tepidariorum]
MSRIPHIGLTKQPSQIQDENAFRRPIGSQTVKRSVENQSGNQGNQPAVKKLRVEVSSTTSNKKRAVSGSRIFIKNAGFSDIAKKNALKPIPDSNLMRGSMPALNLAKSSRAVTVSKPPKRQPWDLKGRIQDMEETFKETQKQNTTLLEQLAINNQRIAALESDNSLLNKDVQIKSCESEEAMVQISELQKKLKKKSDECEVVVKEKECLSSKLEELNKKYNDFLNAHDQEVSALRLNISSLTSNKLVVQTQLDASESVIKNLNEEKRQLIEEKRKLIESNSEKDRRIANLESRLLEEESTRRKLHNTIQELKGNIRVFCRMRPPLDEEMRNGMVCADISVPNRKMIEIFQISEGNKIEKKSDFSFDCVFPPSSPQAEVFEEISQLVQSAIDGYNVCIFAYGQTGSGKTYTMEGPENIVDFSSSESETHLGMIPRSVQQIFRRISELEHRGWTYKVEALFLEIYNERIQDLLNRESQNGSRCEIKKSAAKGNDCLLSNVSASPVTCSDDVFILLKKARKSRVVFSTKCNEHSSRSHYVFQLKIVGENSITSESCEGILNLVDLAGSERVKDSGSEGERLTEAKAINKSLSVLGKVIMSLSRKDNHIPYRDSKLTHLLANSLGGNSKTLMFVNISPDKENLNETINSLRFATKVNQCNIGTAQKRVK